MTRRGGNHGGGPTITRVELTSTAARELRRRVTGDYATRYTKAQANAAASEVLDLLAAGRLMFITDDMRAMLAWLMESRATALGEVQHGIDQLIAALWTTADTEV